MSSSSSLFSIIKTPITPEKRKNTNLAKETDDANKKEEKASPKKLKVPVTLFAPIQSNSQGAIEVHGEGPTVYLGQEYSMLKRLTPIATHLKLSCRSKAKREDLLLDMQSVVLKACFNNFLSDLKLKEVFSQKGDPDAITQPLEDFNASLEEAKKADSHLMSKPYDMHVLEILVSHAAHVFQPTTEYELNALIELEHAANNSASSKTVAPLEWFIKFQKGYCRHQALYVAYLLCNLIEYAGTQNNCDTAKNKVYRYRRKLQSLVNPEKWDSHAVVILAAEDGHWYMLDPSRRIEQIFGLVIDLTTLSDEDKTRLRHYYPHHNVDQFLDIIKKEYSIIPEYNEAPLTSPTPPPSPTY